MLRPAQQRHDHREQDQQRHIHRQDVEVGRLEMQHQRLQHGAVRLLPQHVEVDLVEVVRPVEGGGGIRHLGGEDHEQEDVRDIQRPGALQRVRRGIYPAVPVHRTPVSQAGAVPGEQHEDLGRIAKGEVAEAEPVDPVGGDVVGEDPPQRDPAEEIHPHVAASTYQLACCPSASRRPGHKGAAGLRASVSARRATRRPAAPHPGRRACWDGAPAAASAAGSHRAHGRPCG